MSRTIPELKVKLTEALGAAGVPNDVIAQIDQVFAQHEAPQTRAARKKPVRKTRVVKTKRKRKK